MTKNPSNRLLGGGWPDSGKASVHLSAIDSTLPMTPELHGFTCSVASWETLPAGGRASSHLKALA